MPFSNLYRGIIISSLTCTSGDYVPGRSPLNTCQRGGLEEWSEHRYGTGSKAQDKFAQMHLVENQL